MLDDYKGKTITEICPFKYDRDNQCAHFVSHVLELSVATTCKNISWDNRQNKAIATGASLRANQVYNNSCQDRGLWTSRKDTVTSCLIFITDASNVKDNIMSDFHEKHVGIYLSGTIWQYSNSHKEVQTADVDSWFKRIDAIYKGDNITLYFGIP